MTRLRPYTVGYNSVTILGIPWRRESRTTYSRQYTNDRHNQENDEEETQRELREEHDREDEPEPVHDDLGERLGDLDEKLERHDYPTTTEDLIDASGDQELESQDGTVALTEILDRIDNEMYK